MTERKHTALPWVYSKERDTHDYCIHSEEYGYIDEGGVVGSSEWIWITDEDAEFIVRACNSFYDLIDALEVEDDAKRLNAHDFVAKHGHDLVGMNSPARKKLRREALAKARGETE